MGKGPRATRGMVVTPHPLATRAAVDVMSSGGNAVDAAVAANAVLAVVYPGSCGLGGDAFALVWRDHGQLYGFNGSGRSPLSLTIDLMRDNGHIEMPQRGPLTVTVPGVVDAWSQLLGKLGTLSLGDCFAPAIRVAEAGYRLTAVNLASLEGVGSFANAAAQNVFLPGGAAPSLHGHNRQPHLARTLRTIADGGRDAFYMGSIAEQIADAVRQAGGVLTAEDIGLHRGEWVSPISTSYGDVEVATTPPNSQGITALLALNVLQALNWPGVPARTRQAEGSPLVADRVHAQIEAIKVAWSERDRCVTDPDRRLCSPTALLTRRHAINLARRLDMHAAQTLISRQPPGGGTVYLCTADADGTIVSLIQSLYLGFGSGIMAGRTGVMLQNRGAYFSLDPTHPNRLAPRSRTLHTLMPSMLLRNGEAFSALGAMGGDGQPQTLVQLVNDVADDGLDPQQAVARARFIAEVEGQGMGLGPITIEADGVTSKLITELEGRGHQITVVPPRSRLMGWAQMIRREADGSWTGGADPRADSVAAGI